MLKLHSARAPRLDEVTVWISEVHDWALAVAAEIEKIDAADAEWFRMLDAVPPPRVKFNEVSSEFTKAFRELDFMLVRLERLLTNRTALYTVAVGSFLKPSSNSSGTNTGFISKFEVSAIM